MRKIRAIIGVIAILGLLTACKSAEEERLERTVRWTKRTLEDVNTNPGAALSYMSLTEMGGRTLDYVTASKADDADLTRLEQGAAPSRPWTVLLTEDPDTGVITIAGYGEDLDAPLHEETVTLAPGPVDMPR